MLGLVFSPALMGQVSVLTEHYNTSRTGANMQETVLNTSNVNMANFGKLFAQTVDGYIYAEPLYVPNLTIAGKARNVVFVATEHNSVYAFDADDGSIPALWQTNLDGPGETSVPSNDICVQEPSACGPNNVPGYVDLQPEIGITSTPVIDSTTNTIYVVAKTKDSSGNYHYRLHALDLLSGNHQPATNNPAEITADSGFTLLTHINRPGLLLLNNVVYMAFGSVGDFPTWHGYVMAYRGWSSGDPQSLQRLAFLNTTPTSSSSGGGIWGGGQGLIGDSGGNVYAVTSNGGFDANVGGSNYATSFLKLTLSGSSLVVSDYFTPCNQSYLGNNSNNVDLGSGGPLLLPGTTWLASAGKDGVLRIVNSANMGKFSSPCADFSIGPDNDVQEWQATPNIVMGSPVYWNSPKFGPAIYLWGPGDTLKAWAFNPQTNIKPFGNPPMPASQSTVQSVLGEANSVPLAVSANGSTAGSGIVWASMPKPGGAGGGDANVTAQPGILRAFDGSDLTHELWDSEQNSTRDGVGYYAKFNPPTIANGKVYLGSFAPPNNPGASQLLVYGLFAASNFTVTAGPNSQSVTAGSSASYVVYVSSQAGFSGTVALNCAGPLPAGISCSFSPASVTVGSSGTASAKLTVTTAAPTALLRAPGKNVWLPLYAAWLPLSGIALAGLGLGSRRRRMGIGLACLLMISFLLLLVACGGGGTSSGGGGGGGGGTQPGTYNITINASAGSMQHTTAVALTVQ